jgi:CRISPR-associated endonuclease/helicase Cas3
MVLRRGSPQCHTVRDLMLCIGTIEEPRSGAIIEVQGDAVITAERSHFRLNRNSGYLRNMMFWAHSDPSGLAEGHPKAKWQPLAEHLENVGKLARYLASLAAPGDAHFHDIAEWSGLLHDFGKYQDGFQQMIRTGVGRCPHAIHGAAIAYAGQDGARGLRAAHVAHAIAGHHAGMPDRAGDGASLQERVKAANASAVQLIDRAMHDSVALRRLLEAPAPKLENLQGRFDLFTRMAFSCLVDADRLDTAGRAPEQAPLRAGDRLETLLRHINELKSDSSQIVTAARLKILDDCLSAASYPERLLSLSAPTGGGKTLSAMAFALKRAALQPSRYRRIIIVIPYLSIIEQNAQVYTDVFGKDAVLEHHSGSFERLVGKDKDHFAPADDDEQHDYRPFRLPATENWDAPIVVTTSVRFFESLFSNRPSDLRRVHNIAGSIVILDEVQVLPRSLLAPLLDMMRELSDHWRCTFVLSTATKPAFEKADPLDRRDPRWPQGTLREIIADPASLHTRLRRVTIDWRISEPVDWLEVAGWMRDHRQALCVVNLRDHAMRLFHMLADMTGPEERSRESLFHLSTRMCPAHRLHTIAAIRRRLNEGLPCLVVSTQLIEAGVDIDFPVAFRALGPLDAIIQVAGRADRAGKLTAALGAPAGRLVVFLPKDHRLPPNDYKYAAGITWAAAKRQEIQPDDLVQMAQFYERYYEDTDLGSEFQSLRKNTKFKTLAAKFEMISSRTQDVIVPYGEGELLIEELRRIGILTAHLRSRSQRFTVGLHPWEFEAARQSVLAEIRSGNNIWEASNAAYDSETGLRTSLDPEQLII